MGGLKQQTPHIATLGKKDRKKSWLAVVCVVFDQGLRTCISMRPSHPRKHETMRTMLPHVQGNEPPCKASHDSTTE